MGAPLERFDEELDEAALGFFSEADRRMSPEEYAARHAHNFACFALHMYRYRDPVLGVWARRLGEILSDAGDEVQRCRSRHLGPEELIEVQRGEAEGF